MTKNALALVVVVAACGGGKKQESPAFHGAAVSYPDGFSISPSGDLAAIEGQLGGRAADMLRLKYDGVMPDAEIESLAAGGWKKETDGPLTILHREGVPQSETDEVMTFVKGSEGVVRCIAIVPAKMDLGGYLDICRSLHAK